MAGLLNYLKLRSYITHVVYVSNQQPNVRHFACNMTHHIADTVLKEGWLVKYSKVLNQPRDRYAVLMQSTSNDADYYKRLVTFKSVKDSKIGIEKATEIININNTYNVQEYFGSLNKRNDDFYFLLNDKYVFMCNDGKLARDNVKSRDEWINAIIYTDFYCTCDECNSYYGNGSAVNIETGETGNESKELTQDLPDQKTHDHTQNNNENKYAYERKTVSIRIRVRGWEVDESDIAIESHQIWINVDVLSKILTFGEFVKDCETELAGVNIVGLLNSPQEIKSLCKDIGVLDFETASKTRFLFKEHKQHWIDISKIFMSNMNQTFIMKNGFNFLVKKQSLTGTSISNIYSDVDTTKSIVNNQNRSLCKAGVQCPIYLSMKNDYQFTQLNYHHIKQFDHFNNSINNKPACKYGAECHAFVRMENNRDYRFDDQCHMMIYKHPPRGRRQMELASNMNKLLMIERAQLIGKQVKHSSNLVLLINEVIKNGYKRDLCLNDSDYRNNYFSILKIVNEKMDDVRHKQLRSPLTRAEMLSLIMYTGCDCNYDLCKQQRTYGDYNKWYNFDRCLTYGIKKLSKMEQFDDNPNGKFRLYSGLHKVKLDKKSINLCYFPTYISTSWEKDVSLSFVQNQGMLIEIDGNVANQFVCCSVDWISKFPDECEVLMARTDGIDELTDNPARLQVIQNHIGKQYNTTIPNKKTAKVSSQSEICGHDIQHVKLQTNKHLVNGVVSTAVGNLRFNLTKQHISSLLSLLDTLRNLDLSIIKGFANNSFTGSVR